MNARKCARAAVSISLRLDHADANIVKQSVQLGMQAPKSILPFEIPEKLVFRPSKAAIESSQNVKRYLADACIVGTYDSADSESAETDFSGAKWAPRTIQETKNDAKGDTNDAGVYSYIPLGRATLERRPVTIPRTSIAERLHSMAGEASSTSPYDLNEIPTEPQTFPRASILTNSPYQDYYRTVGSLQAKATNDVSKKSKAPRVGPKSIYRRSDVETILETYDMDEGYSQSSLKETPPPLPTRDKSRSNKTSRSDTQIIGGSVLSAHKQPAKHNQSGSRPNAAETTRQQSQNPSNSSSYRPSVLSDYLSNEGGIYSIAKLPRRSVVDSLILNITESSNTQAISENLPRILVVDRNTDQSGLFNLFGRMLSSANVHVPKGSKIVLEFKDSDGDIITIHDDDGVRYLMDTACRKADIFWSVEDI